jgi:hypothetical protein
MWDIMNANETCVEKPEGTVPKWDTQVLNRNIILKWIAEDYVSAM